MTAQRETFKDPLAPLAPPPPSARPVVDAAHDSEHDPRRARFDEIKNLPAEQQYVSLSALIEEFIVAGHNPRDPTDIMFEILGVSPEFLELMLFTLQKKARPGPPTDAKPLPAKQPAIPPADEVTISPESQITS